MNKYKINYTIAAILLLASFFAGWQTMIIVGALLFVFCEMGENLKNLAVNLISFSIGIKLVELLWGIIYNASVLIPKIIEKFIGIINNYLSSYNQISLGKINLYVFDPIMKIFDIGNNIFDYLVLVASFVFITSLFVGANKKGFIIGGYITKYVNKVLNYVFQFSASQPVPTASVQNFNNQMSVNQNMNNIQQNNNNHNFNGQSNNMM